jgi:N-acetylneuraminic acid mutarotase
MKLHHLKKSVICFILIAVFFIGASPFQSVQAVAGGWSLASNMKNPLTNHTATLLPNGKVLVAAGLSGSYVNLAELYDPDLNTWTYTGSLHHSRYYHSATLLATGNVLVVGGLSGTTLSSAEIYDSVAGTWTDVASMQTARYLHTATRLANGDVLVTGGANSGGMLSSSELYDPASNTWTLTGSMNTARVDHTATLLPDGRVLVVGGSNTIHTVFLNTAELYDPTTGIWTPVTNHMSTARYGHTATLLSNGKVLIAGGSDGPSKLNTAELFDPDDETWTPSSHVMDPLNGGRYYHTATLINYVDHSESVLITGGIGTSVDALNTAVLYDPAGDTWAPTGSLVNSRKNHVAVMLLNGKVLVAGGLTTGGGKTNTAELYDPTAPSGPPDVPELESPEGLTNLEPSYVWQYSSGSTAYHITIYDVTRSVYILNNILVNTSFCSGGLCTFHPQGELNTGSYKFKVNASNALYTSADSEWMEFSVHGNNLITGDAGTSDVTFTYFDVRLKSVTSSSNDYSLTVSYTWTGTITPSKPGYQFAPVDRTFTTPITSDQSDVDFTASRIPFTIRGNAASLSDVAMRYLLDGVPTTATSLSGGNYTVNVYWGWSGDVKPFKVGYVFSPLNKTYILVQENHLGQDYLAEEKDFSISGNAGISNATVNYSMNGTPGSTVADSNGLYSFSVPAYSSGTITPSKAGYSFSPASIDVTEIPGNLSGQNFTAMVSLSGSLSANGSNGIVFYAGQSGSTVYNGSVSADGSGGYSFNVPVNWTGNITPFKPNFKFNPLYRIISTPVTTLQTGLDFTASLVWQVFLPQLKR